MTRTFAKSHEAVLGLWLYWRIENWRITRSKEWTAQSEDEKEAAQSEMRSFWNWRSLFERERERERERVHFTKNVVIQVTMKLCSHLNIQIARNDSKLRQIWRGRVRSLVILENHTQQRIKSEQTEDEKVRVLSGTGVESQVVCDPSFLGTVRRRRERHAHSEGISIISGWQRYNY